MKTKVKMPAFFRLGLMLATLLTACVAHAGDLLVNAVVDVTPEGRNAPRAAPAAPIYYFPFTIGYSEQGVWPAENLPPAIEVQHMIAKALAAQGYLVMKSKPASLLLTFRWGRMAPIADDRRLDEPEEDMATLVGGLNKGRDISGFNPYLPDFQLAASVPRYFVTIEAFDFMAAEQKNKIPLWCARISAPAAGTTLEKALPTLLAAAVPLLGEDVRPRRISVP